MTPVWVERRERATRLEEYPSSSITVRTRSAVVAATPYRPLTTFDTVATETPAARATSVMVTLRRAFMTESLSC